MKIPMFAGIRLMQSSLQHFPFRTIMDNADMTFREVAEESSSIYVGRYGLAVSQRRNAKEAQAPGTAEGKDHRPVGK